MAESQLHGFTFESLIISEFNLVKDAKYTSKWDAYTELDIPVSIKSTKTRNLGLGDPFKFFEVKSSFNLIVVCYTQLNLKKEISKVLNVLMSIEFIKKHFVEELLDDLAKLNLMIKSVPPGPVSRATRETIFNFKKDLEGKFLNFNSNLKLNPKLDSKSQRRLQCTLDLDIILTELPYQSIESLVGVSIISAARIRRKSRDNS